MVGGALSAWEYGPTLNPRAIVMRRRRRTILAPESPAFGPTHAYRRFSHFVVGGRPNRPISLSLSFTKRILEFCGRHIWIPLMG